MARKLDSLGDVKFDDGDIELLEEKRCHDGFFKLDRVKLRHRKFDGNWSGEVYREIIHRKDAVGVLVYDPDLDAVCLVQQFRSAVMGLEESPWPYELVAGLIDKEGESEEDVARRELQEEAGIEVSYLEKINSYWLSIGGSNERMHLYAGLASLKEVGGIHGVEGETEDILTLVVSREEARKWAFERMESNASSIIALQWLEVERHRLVSVWQNCQ